LLDAAVGPDIHRPQDATLIIDRPEESVAGVEVAHAHRATDDHVGILGEDARAGLGNEGTKSAIRIIANDNVVVVDSAEEEGGVSRAAEDPVGTVDEVGVPAPIHELNMPELQIVGLAENVEAKRVRETDDAVVGPQALQRDGQGRGGWRWGGGREVAG
jgi:hypothetical protein